ARSSAPRWVRSSMCAMGRTVIGAGCLAVQSSSSYCRGRMNRRSPALLFLAFAPLAIAPASVSAQAPPPRLTSRGYVTWIYAHPRTTERFVGYVRNGSSIALRSEGLVPGEGCPGGFYPVEPRGFVCNDRTVTRAPSALAVETAAAAASVPG